MSAMSNPLMALIRQRASGVADPSPIAGMSPGPADMDIGLQDPNVLPEAPQQGAPAGNDFNNLANADVLPPQLNPIKGLFHKMAWALGQSIRQQFGMPTDVELAQQDFKNRLEVKTYKMQQAAAQSQEDLRKQQIEQSRAENRIINVPGRGNVLMKDMPGVMHDMATEQQANFNYQRQLAEDKARDERAASHERTMMQIADKRLASTLALFRERAGQKDDPNRQLTVMEAGQLGVPFGTRVGEVQGSGFIPTPAGVRSKFEDRAAAIDSASTLIDQADSDLKAYGEASWTSPMQKGQSLMNARGNIAALPTLIGRLAGEVGNMSEGDRAAYTKLVSPPGGIATIAADPEAARNYLGIARKFIAARRSATSAAQERMTGRPLAPPTTQPTGSRWEKYKVR